MKPQLVILFLVCNFLFVKASSAEALSSQVYDQSCREINELMVSGNKLMFLRSNLAATGISWKAVICLHCSASRESGLLRVTNIKDGSTDWHYKDKDFLAIDEVLAAEDDLSKETLGLHSILGQVRVACKSYLDPVNEGSHLQLTGNESCVRHEYLRLYLKRRFDLNENFYVELESKKNLARPAFFQSCRQTFKQSNDRNIILKKISAILIIVKRFFGGGLGEYEPVVSRDTKSYDRTIATETPLK
jgi:hypothetical protein